MALRRLLPLALLLAALCLPWTAQAKEKPKPEDGFDPAKVETIGVTITDIKIIPAKSSNGYIGPGLSLAVDWRGQSLEVPLGPKWFLDRQPVKLAVGDQVELRGMHSGQARPTFLVAEIKKEKAVAVYRDRDGFLYWRKAQPVEKKTTPPPRPRRTSAN